MTPQQQQPPPARRVAALADHLCSSRPSAPARRAPAAAAGWAPLDAPEGDAASLLESCPDPLAALANGDVPAVLLRGALSPEACGEINRLLIERQLMHDPAYPASAPLPGEFIEVIGEGKSSRYEHTPAAETAGPGRGRWTPTRIDIGTSQGTHSHALDEFLDHSAGSHQLFASLFSGQHVCCVSWTFSIENVEFAPNFCILS
jgi:hypothetical protein